MRYLIIVSFLFLVLEGSSQKIMPMVGTNVRIFYNNQKESHILSEASTEPGVAIGVQLQPAGKRAPLFMASFEYTGASIKNVDSGLAGYEDRSAEYHFFQLGLAAYTFNGHIKSWSGGIGLRADVVLFEKSQGRYELIIMGREQKNEDIHITYPRVLQRFKIGPSVYVKKTVQMDEKNAIEPFLYSTLYLSDEVKFGYSKALVMGFGVAWVMR